MDLSFSDDFLKALEFSRDEAIRTGWHNICPDHIMLGILRVRSNSACTALETLGLVPEIFKSDIDTALFVPEQVSWDERESINLCDSARSMLQHAALEAQRCGASAIESIHFLLACNRINGSYSHDWLEDRALSQKALVEAAGLKWVDYGLASPRTNSDAQKKEAAAPDPQIMAAAIEKRLREGYAPGNPIVS